MKKEEKPVVVEQKFAVPREQVWKAITDREQMVQWYFDAIPAFEPTVGFETSFDIQNEQRNFRHLWKVTEVVPLERLQYDWSYEEFPGESFVLFELSEDGEHCTLRVTHAVREDFSDEIPEFRRASCLAGWCYFLQDSLPQFFSQRGA